MGPYGTVQFPIHAMIASVDTTLVPLGSEHPQTTGHHDEEEYSEHSKDGVSLVDRLFQVEAV